MPRTRSHREPCTRTDFRPVCPERCLLWLLASAPVKPYFTDDNAIGTLSEGTVAFRRDYKLRYACSTKGWRRACVSGQVNYDALSKIRTMGANLNVKVLAS